MSELHEVLRRIEAAWTGIIPDTGPLAGVVVLDASGEETQFWVLPVNFKQLGLAIASSQLFEAEDAKRMTMVTADELSQHLPEGCQVIPGEITDHFYTGAELLPRYLQVELGKPAVAVPEMMWVIYVHII